MKAYVTPMMTSEVFTPNEYIAVCWQVACKVGQGNYGEYGERQKWYYWNNQRPYGNNCNDHTGSCSDAVNNIFTVDTNGNVTFDFENSSDQGALRGGFTDYIDNNNNNVIDSGDTIFWYTSTDQGGNRRWNHYGIVEATVNRS